MAAEEPAPRGVLRPILGSPVVMAFVGLIAFVAMKKVRSRRKWQGFRS